MAALIDPIGTLIGMGLSWVLEHIWPLNDYLNLLTWQATGARSLRADDPTGGLGRQRFTNNAPSIDTPDRN